MQTATRSQPMPAFMRPLSRVFAALAVLTALAALAPAQGRASMLDTAMEAVLVVRSADAADRFLGSAFVWGTEGEVAVTNAHVVGEAAEVRLQDRAGATIVAPVIARDPLRDVAVIGLPPGRTGLATGPVPVLGEAVWALGAPLGAEFTATRGMVSASARQVEPTVPLRLLQHDAAVNPGSSGGPLIDAEGRVVGMNSRIADGSRHYVGISYAISAPDLSRIVGGLVAETLPPVPRLGLMLRPVSRQIAAALGLTPGGALVDRVEPGSPAARAGLAAGDVIRAADGRAVASPGDLAFAVEAAVVRGSVSLSVIRAGGPVEMLLPLVPPQAMLATREPGAGVARVSAYSLADLGVTVADRDGPVVGHLTEASPAALAGMARGDRSMAVNGKPVGVAALAELRLTAPALILVERRGGATLHILLDPWDAGAGFRPQGGANVLDPSVAVF